MVLVEAGGEVAADRVSWLLALGRAEAVGDELQVLFQVFLRPRHADELDEAVGGVVRTNQSASRAGRCRRVGGEGLVLAGVEADVAAVGVDQPRLVEAVAAHHAADGVGDQPLDVLFTVGAVEGDLVVGNFGRKFVLQAVGVDEEAVILFLESLFVDADMHPAAFPIVELMLVLNVRLVMSKGMLESP